MARVVSLIASSTEIVCALGCEALLVGRSHECDWPRSVLRLPARFTVAPIFTYRSGQPWNWRLGYDRNGDGRNSDRPDNTPRFNQDGPNYMSFDVRLTYGLPLGSRTKSVFLSRLMASRGAIRTTCVERPSSTLGLEEVSITFRYDMPKVNSSSCACARPAGFQ